MSRFPVGEIKVAHGRHLVGYDCEHSGGVFVWQVESIPAPHPKVIRIQADEWTRLREEIDRLLAVAKAVETADDW